jgi:subtilase family serine protease
MAQDARPAVRIVNQIDESQRVTLKGTMHPLANAANDRGAAADSMKLERMHLVLKRSDSQESSLRQLISDLHTPGTANYHMWLTPEQFGKQFGPSDEDIATVEAWLTSHGFSIAQVNPGKQTIEFSGSVGQMREAFHTQIHRYLVKGETHFANANDPQIPAALAPVVGGFVSLNNFRLKSHATPLGKATYDPKTDKATPQWTMGGGGYYSFVLSPGDYAVQYDLNPLYKAGVNGTGQTIAIVNESNINIGLVNQFRSLFGLPVNPPQVIIDGNDPGVDGINNPDGPNGASVEAYLDVEWAGAVAPNATVDLVIAADTALEQGLVLAGEHAIYANVAPIISLSFGACEASLGTENAFLSSLYEQAAAQGITVLVSTGDDGSANCDNPDSQDVAFNGQAVSGFASTPFNVAVGGTDFYYSAYNSGSTALDNQIATYWATTPSNNTPAVSILGVIPEQPWNGSQYGLNINNYYANNGDTTIAAGSGGASAVYTTKPTWQTGFGDTARDIPDLSLFAASGANASYYPICADDGDCQPVSSGGTVQIFGVGGTSASTPSFAGIMALVNQKYGRQGQADFVLYPLAKQYPAAFHDVTVGTNSVPCEISPTVTANCIAVSSPNTVTETNSNGSTYSLIEGQIGSGTTAEYNAGVGYDLASGLGTVDANVLVTDWNKVTFAKTGTSMSVTPANSAPLNNIPHGTAVTVSGNVTAASGTPTGDVALMTDSTEPGQQGQAFFTLSSGAYTGSVNTLPGGTYNIWAQYGGDANNAMSNSAKTQITVAPENSGILFQAFAPSATYTAGQTVSGTIDYGTQLLLSAQVEPSAALTCTSNCPSFTTPTGTVTFTDSTSGSGLPNTAVINAEGDAEFNAPFAVGTHAVTASYSGDGSYNKSTASAITFTVGKDTPQIFIGASNQTSATNVFQVVGGSSGQPTVLNVILENNAIYNSSSPVSVAPPSGSVSVTGFPSGVPTSATLSAAVDPSDGAPAGIGTITIPASTAAGNYNVAISYAGDGNYAATSASGTIQIVSNGMLNSSTSATTSGSISPTSTITVTGTVTGQSGHPAPTSSASQGYGVLIFSSGNYLGEVLFSSSSGITSNFSFTLDSQDLYQGANFITVQYTGDNVYNPSAVTLNSGSPISNPLSDFTLIPQSTIVPVTAGSSGTDTINLASVNGFSGTVSLSCQAAAGVTCSITPSATLGSGGNGAATLTVNAGTYAANIPYNVLISGTDSTGAYVHTLGVQAVVSGSVAGSTSFLMSNSGNIAVDGGATTGNTSTITVTPVGGFTGPVALKCSVSGPTGATSPATCSIPSSVTLSGTAAQTATLTVNTAVATTGGVYTVTVTGTSGAIVLTTAVTATVTMPGLNLSNGGSITIGTAGGSGTSTITVTPSNGLTGVVNLACSVTATPTGATNPATCSIPASVTISGTTAQTATLTVNTTASTTPGAYSVTVTGTQTPITGSTVVAVTVGTPGIGMSNGGAISVAPGASTGNTSTVTLTSQGGFAGTVNLACSIAPTAASDPASCSLASSSVQVSPTVTPTVVLTVYTTAASASMNRPNKLFWPSAGGTVLALVFLFGIPKRRRNWLTMLGLLILFVSAAGIGCGGGGSSGGGGGNTGTTPGTYTVTVTGTSGSLTASTNVTLTVN